MVREGYKDVGQLHGGIATYGKTQKFGELWDGKYVFDERIAVDINHGDPVVIGKTGLRSTPCERYVNFCVTQNVTVVLSALKKTKTNTYGCCHECRVHPRNRYVQEHNLPLKNVARLVIGEELIQ